MFVTLGTINGVYGVKGWVKVYSYTSPIENILNYKTWQLCKNNQNKAVRLEGGKKHGKGIIAKLEGYDDRNAVEILLKSEIKVARDSLPELPEGEYYWGDLQGLQVTNMANINFGKVDHLFETGANDVMVVKGEKERLIPFVQDIYIKDINLHDKTMLVDWPEDFE
jgi:16S rRNA processing protein RimM